MTLYWSTRGARDAVIYQLVRGVRNRLWNVGPDGSLPVQTSRNDRGTVDFVLSVGEGSAVRRANAVVPLACPDVWFFQPPPEACPTAPAQDTQLIEEPFERGRMLYVATSNQIYALFNDGLPPAWLVLENRFDPASASGKRPEFLAAARLLSTAAAAGLRLARQRYGAQPAGAGDAAGSQLQRLHPVVADAGRRADALRQQRRWHVLQLLPQGASWQIITPP